MYKQLIDNLRNYKGVFIGEHLANRAADAIEELQSKVNRLEQDKENENKAMQSRSV